MEKHYTKKLGNVIEINKSEIQDHLGELVRRTVEETLNSMLGAEADTLCNAAQYERTESRTDTRAGYYSRILQTKAGDMILKVPKLRQQKFERVIIERYRRRESSVEEALVERCLWPACLVVSARFVLPPMTSRLMLAVPGSPPFGAV